MSLEIPDKDPLKVCLVADAVIQEEFEPCLNMLPHIDGEVLNDEVVIIHSSGSAGEPEVFEPYTGIHFPGVFGDVGRWSEALWERRTLDAMTKGPWPLGCMSPHSSMVRLGPVPPALITPRWASSSRQA